MWQGFFERTQSRHSFRICNLAKMPLCNNLNYLHHFELFGIVVKNVMKQMKLTKYRKYLEKPQSLAKLDF